jgi:OmpA-OmpF porin, OOP family
VQSPKPHPRTTQSTWDGSGGGIFIVDPDLAAPGALQLQLALDWYAGRGFLHEGERVEQERQRLSMSWVLLEHLEIYSSLLNRSTFFESPDGVISSPHTLGDSTVGAKVGGKVTPFLRLGLDVRLLMRNDITARAGLFPNLSFGVRGSVAFDLRRIANPAPLIVRLNLDYLFDGSSRLLPDHEQRLPTRNERFGYAIAAADLFTLGWGVAVPLGLAPWLSLEPIVDYRLGIPVGSTACELTPSEDACFPGTRPPFATWPMNIALGVRAVHPGSGASMLIGTDIGLSGIHSFSNEVAPNPPYRFLVAFGVGLDFNPLAARKSGTPPARTLAGRVHDEASGEPLAGVLIRVSGRPTALVSDAGGYFELVDPAPGALELALSEANHAPGRCFALIPETGTSAPLRCVLGSWTGLLKIGVHEPGGDPVQGAQVELTGPSLRTGTTDAAGELELNELEPGEYELRIQSESHLQQRAQLQIAPPHRKKLEITLFPKPRTSMATLHSSEIRAPALRFAKNTANPLPEARIALAEIADLLLHTPSIERVRISGYGGRLAAPRAQAVERELIAAGVAKARIEVADDVADRVVIRVVATTQAGGTPAEVTAE